MAFKYTVIGTADRSQHKSKLSFQTGAIFLSACQTSDYEETDRILSLGDKKIINYANSDGLTALHQASIDGNLQMIKYLVEKGADINVTGTFIFNRFQDENSQILLCKSQSKNYSFAVVKHARM